ncbi:hypothetical protein AVEN_12411-1 [Araneus ventricosus]|uniref:Uncharacterized protein n=1 Tax=Araneus ventricosus TaxID=182803 RepID=A0A4Y2NME5_ARAVE|nr:hypothetical protein AVEN_12411-1 [Araneus ventricosus]
MQWAVSLLHFIELPFRALFMHIDGTTSSPHSYTGPIGSKLPDYEKLPVVSFKPIKCDLPFHSADDLRKFNNNLRYLFQISKVIKSGECPEDLASVNLGKLNKTRWLTSANRTLRLSAYRQFLPQLNSLVGLPAPRDFTATKLFSCDGCAYMRFLISFDSPFLDALAVFSRTAHALRAPK